LASYYGEVREGSKSTANTAKIAACEACYLRHMGISLCCRGRKLRQTTMEPLAAVAQHIADWRNNLGMFEYAPRFAENYIDNRALCGLPDICALNFRAAKALRGNPSPSTYTP
jgi:hypothetical protein